MIKDDMSGDAEFDAFLKGEGALARQLQALDQPSPSPALDAAILANARAALADARPAAANDAAPANQRTVPAQLSWRWRVPAGIAATLLVGLIARQSFDADQGQPRYDVPVPVPVPVAEAPVPAAAVEAEQAPAAPPAPPAPVTGQVTGAADNVAPAPARERRVEKPAASTEMAPAEGAPAPPAPVAVRAQPSPAPMMMPAPAPVAEPMIQPAPAPAAAPAAAASAKPSMDALLEREVTVSGSRIVAPTPQEAAAEERRAAERTGTVAKQQRRARGFNATGLDKPAAPVESAALMLERVERLIQEDKQEAAFAAWEALRRTYPNYPVPDSVREKMEPPPQVPDMR